MQETEIINSGKSMDKTLDKVDIIGIYANNLKSSASDNQ